MLNLEIGTYPIGPNGEYGTVTVGFVNGKLSASVALSPKAAIDAAAKKIGGVVPAEVAAFLESSIGLS